MRSLACFSVVLAVVCLLAAPAAAQHFRVLDGQITDTVTGISRDLGGHLEFGVRPSPAGGLFLPPPGVDRFDIVDFDLASDGQLFVPVVPHTLEGLTAPFFLRALDVLDLTGDRVVFLRLAAGSEVVARTESTVTFRDWSFVADDGVAYDRETNGGGLPDRFVATGRLTAHDTTRAIRRELCVVPAPVPPVLVPPPLMPPGGVITGATITIGGGGTIEIVTSGGGIRRTPDAVATLRDPEITSLGELPPQDVGLTITAVGVPISLGITLEDLGIVAPQGAAIFVDLAGTVRVESDGLLRIDAGTLAIEGMTRLTIISQTSIEVASGGIELPQDVVLELRAGTIDIAGPIDAQAGLVLVTDSVSLVPVACLSFPAIAHELAGTMSFELEAALEQPVEIRLLDRRRHRHHRYRHHRHQQRHRAPAFRRTLSVAVLGSDELDVRDIDPHTVRLGPDEASPLRWRRRATRRRDVNRDGHRDLILRFATPDTGLALGDTEVCLTGETWHGPAIAGCDEIEPVRRRARRAGDRVRSHSHRGHSHRGHSHRGH